MSRRELIEPHEGDKRYVRRDDRGRFTQDQTSVGRSLTRDAEQHATTRGRPGEGDRDR